MAIILVLLGHFGIDPKLPWFSSLGVDLFFALSGRLMADILFVRQMPLPAFFARRFVRVYPTLFVFVLVSLVVTQGTMLAFNLKTALLALTFTLNYAMAYGHDFTTLDHIWSLCVEEHSYILLAIIAGACRAMSPRSAGYVILAVGLAATANGAIQLDILHRSDFAVLWRTDTAMAGIFLAAGFRILLAGRSIGWIWMVPLSMLCALLARALGTEAFFYFGLKSIFLGLAVAGVEQARPPIRTLFETKLLQSCGRCSFSIYLWQELFYKLARQDIMPRFPFLVMAVVGGIIGYYLTERPLRSMLVALLARRDALRPGPSPVH